MASIATPYRELLSLVQGCHGALRAEVIGTGVGDRGGTANGDVRHGRRLYRGVGTGWRQREGRERIETEGWEKLQPVGRECSGLWAH